MLTAGSGLSAVVSPMLHGGEMGGCHDALQAYLVGIAGLRELTTRRQMMGSSRWVGLENREFLPAVQAG